MKQELSNIFSVPKPVSITATIRSRISPGRYSLADDTGRILQAESTNTWYPGSRVVVENGRIVSSGGRYGNIKIYEV